MNQEESMTAVALNIRLHNNYWSREMMIMQKEQTKRNKGVILKNCVPLSNCISSMNNIQIDNSE